MGLGKSCSIVGSLANINRGLTFACTRPRPHHCPSSPNRMDNGVAGLGRRPDTTVLGIHVTRGEGGLGWFEPRFLEMGRCC
jgi:hypothetical protein